ncbi:hypothetical protein Barb7_02111 [Bacteroidales bacterium Barb7]|nr:hypothetical protein Barb7_02111 [Bacteroidales bacterium Barb7]
MNETVILTSFDTYTYPIRIRMRIPQGYQYVFHRDTNTYPIGIH